MPPTASDDLRVASRAHPEEFAAFVDAVVARATSEAAAVCAAPPGIRTTLDLPGIVPRFG